MCGLKKVNSFASLQKHIVVFAADDCSTKMLAQDWPTVGRFPLQRFWVEQQVAKDAGYMSDHYAQFALMKVLMPFSATLLGYNTICQDVDVVWKRDLIPYLQRLRQQLVVIRSMWQPDKLKNANGGFQATRASGGTLWCVNLQMYSL